MTPTTRLTREQSRARTRQAVVDAAGRVFAARGFGAASMEEIAAEAGFTRGAVYSNFADKAELFLAVLEQRERARAEEVEGLFRAADEPAAFFARLAETNRSHADEFERWTLLGLEFRLYALRNPAVRPALAERDRSVVATMAVGVEAVLGQLGIDPPRPVEELALIVQALDEGMGVRQLLDPDGVRPGQFLDTLALLLEALAALDRERKGSAGADG